MKRPRHATDAASPWKMTRADWIQVVKRAWAQINANNVGLIAAGVAFYCFTAIVPALASIVLSYGLLADAETVSRHITELFGVLPEEAARLVSEQLVGVVETSSGQQGLGLVVALGIALYGVSRATSSMIVALNVAYDEKETRGFIWLTVLSFLLVLGGLALALTAFATTAVLAFLGSLIPDAPGFVLAAIRITSYLLLAGLVVTAAACLYRYAPSRPHAKWLWLSPGALIATVVWLAATAGFGFYAANFGNYNATYGSLGAVVVLLTWLWLSSYVFLIGAELNGELERQTSASVLEDPTETAATDAGIQPVKQEGFANVEADGAQPAAETAAPR
jgi:membrane protein